VLTTGCGGTASHLVPVPATPTAPASSAPATSAPAVRDKPVSAGPARFPGAPGRYRVGERQFVLAEPAHLGVTGQHLGERSLLTVIRYPVARSASGSWAAPGSFPLVMFAPGFQQCSSTYENLLQAWVSAGYVVASVDFPRTSCQVAATAYEPDLVNQPGDVSYVLGQLLALSARPGDFFSGRLNPREVAAAGQSDGGDTVAALGANCTLGPQGLLEVLTELARWTNLPLAAQPNAGPPTLNDGQFQYTSADPGYFARHARRFVELFFGRLDARIASYAATAALMALARSGAAITGILDEAAWLYAEAAAHAAAGALGCQERQAAADGAARADRALQQLHTLFVDAMMKMDVAVGRGDALAASVRASRSRA